MQTNTWEPLVIFSLSHVGGMNIYPELRALEGCYKGQREPSHMVNAATFYTTWIDVVQFDEQEFILFLDNQRNAFLRFAPSYDEAGQKYLGVWRHVPKAVAIARDAWTRDPESDLYYVAG